MYRRSCFPGIPVATAGLVNNKRSLWYCEHNIAIKFIAHPYKPAGYDDDLKVIKMQETGNEYDTALLLRIQGCGDSTIQSITGNPVTIFPPRGKLF